MTGIGQDQNFDHLNLQGINLQQTYLADASFIGANLKGASLQHADFSRAKLIETQLDEADLFGACLTGAYIRPVRNINESRKGGRYNLYVCIKGSTTNEKSTSLYPISSKSMHGNVGIIL